MARDNWFPSSFDVRLPSNGNLASKVALSHFGNIFKEVAIAGAAARVCGSYCYMHNNHPTTPCHFYVRDDVNLKCFLGNGDYTSGSIAPTSSITLTFGMNKSKEFAGLNQKE